MINNINQLEICAQKDLPITLNKLKSLKTSSTSKTEYEKLRAVLYTSKEWSANKEITIYFMKEPPSNISIKNYPLNALDDNGNHIKWDPLQAEIIENFNNFKTSDIIPMIKRVLLERIQPIVNLKFNFVDDPFAMIRIDFDIYSGSWSYLGTDVLDTRIIPYNKPTMNFGWFNISTVLHEFGHMLGLIHEHQSPFGEPIPWNKTELYKWAADTQKWSVQETNSQVLNKYNSTLLNGTVFDPKSIMLYFYPKSLTTNNTGTSMNVRLSPYDVFYINSRYPGSSQTPIEFYKNVYGEDISNIKVILPTTVPPIITNVDIKNFINKINTNQTPNGTILTTLNFEGKIKFIYITLTSKSNIYILDEKNNIVYNSLLNSGENSLVVNINVYSGYKITIKIIDNNEININKLSFVVENYLQKNTINNIFYIIGGILILLFIIALIRIKFKIF